MPKLPPLRAAFAAALITAAIAKAQPPQLLLDVNPQPGVGSFPALIELGAVDGELLLALDDGVHGTEPWRSDGTTAGTTMIADLTPGPAGGIFLMSHTVANRTLFVVNRGTGDELWRTDGTAAGTVMLHAAGTSPITLPQVGAPETPALFFGSGNHTWRTDGSAAGTFALGVGPADVIGTVLGATLLHGYNGDLIVSDGTSATVVGNVPGFLQATHDGRLLQSNFNLLAQQTTFVRLDLPGAPSATTGLLARAQPTPDAFLLVTPTALLRWDGITSPQTLGSWPSWSFRLWPFGDRWAFTATNAAHGNEPWITDGTLAGTHVLDVASGPTGSNPQIVAATAKGLVFWANEGGFGSEPFVTDGTLAGTGRIGDLEPGPGSSFVGGYGWMSGGSRRLLLIVRTTALGGELWITDGTASGTALVADVAPGPAASMITPLGFLTQFGRTAQNAFVWIADDGVHGAEPWVLPLAATRNPLRAYGPRRFDVDDPLLGMPWNLQCRDLSPGDLGVVVAGPPVAACLPLAPLRCLHVDAANVALVATVVPGPGGAWHGSLVLPNQPSAVGLDVVVQPVFLSPTMPLGLDVGNAFWLTF